MRNYASGASRALGVRGEAEAESYLLERGYRILRRNYATRGGEADFVAEEGGCLVFIEVKTRDAASRSSPRDAVTPAKQKRLAFAAQHYLSHHPGIEMPLRFDVVEIVTAFGEVLTILIIDDAFRPEGPEAAN